MRLLLTSPSLIRAAVVVSVVVVFGSDNDTYSASAAEYDRYAGYLPNNKITDIAALDLDQMILNEQADMRTIFNAWKVYTEGGHSGSFATMKLTGLDNTSGNFPVGTTVTGASGRGKVVTGTLKKAVTWNNDDADVEIEVYYDVGDKQEDYLICQVGGLFAFQAANRAGCFQDVGNVTIQGTVYDYNYDERDDNNNENTLQKLSTNAVNSMKGPNDSYYPEYESFYLYYGDFDYADKWVTAAKEWDHTSFQSGRGDFNFSLLTKRTGRGEAMKNGAAYLNIWMEVVRKINDGVAYCELDPPRAELAIDEAVALYTGSLTAEAGEPGILLYALAQIRAHQFKTAGHLGNKDEGDSFVNVMVMREFGAIRDFVNGGTPELCQKAEQSKKNIIDLMKIPIVQGALRYAYMREFEEPPEVADLEKEQGEGATFAAAILPFVHSCNSSDADIIHQNMKIGAVTNYSQVLNTFLRNYDCLQINCSAVGAPWDSTRNLYKNAGPCEMFREASETPAPTPTASMSPSSLPSNPESSSGIGIIVGGVVGGLAAVGITTVMFVYDAITA